MEILDHKNIIHLYETYETADSLYIAMEYVPGVNLDEHLKQSNGHLSEEEARHVFRQLVAAVDYCHRHWVVHRDIKVCYRTFFYCWDILRRVRTCISKERRERDRKGDKKHVY